MGVVFLTGPIGSGKTSLGRALASALDGQHVEGDNFQRPPRPWYATSLSTCRHILAETLRRLEHSPLVVVSYPLRCREWLFYRRRLDDLGVKTRFVALAASYEVITAPSRGRALDEPDKKRVAEMIAQGYERPLFADIVIRTDQPLDLSLSRLISALDTEVS